MCSRGLKPSVWSMCSRRRRPVSMCILQWCSGTGWLRRPERAQQAQAQGCWVSESREQGWTATVHMLTWQKSFILTKVHLSLFHNNQPLAACMLDPSHCSSITKFLFGPCWMAQHIGFPGCQGGCFAFLMV